MNLKVSDIIHVKAPLNDIWGIIISVLDNCITILFHDTKDHIYYTRSLRDRSDEELIIYFTKENAEIYRPRWYDEMRVISSEMWTGLSMLSFIENNGATKIFPYKDDITPQEAIHNIIHDLTRGGKINMSSNKEAAKTLSKRYEELKSEAENLCEKITTLQRILSKVESELEATDYAIRVMVDREERGEK